MACRSAGRFATTSSEVYGLVGIRLLYQGHPDDCEECGPRAIGIAEDPAAMDREGRNQFYWHDQSIHLVLRVIWDIDVAGEDSFGILLNEVHPYGTLAIAGVLSTCLEASE